MRRGAEVVGEDRVLAVLAVPRDSTRRRRGGGTGSRAASTSSGSTAAGCRRSSPRFAAAAIAASRQASRKRLRGSRSSPRARRASCRRRSSSRRCPRGTTPRMSTSVSAREQSRRAAAARPRCRPRAAVPGRRTSSRLDARRSSNAPSAVRVLASLAAASRSARSISSRVIGSDATSAPVASRIAFAIAAAVGNDRRLADPLRAEVRQLRVRHVDQLADDLGHVGDRRHPVGVEARREDLARARVVRRCSESVWPMPWMIPPSIWLEAPSGLITRPTSWIAAMRSTLTSPVSMSTATSATWTPKVSTCMPAGFGPRPPLPRICAFSEQPDDLRRGWRCRRETIVRRERGSRRPCAARESRICRRASAAAARTAGPIDGIVDEPAEIEANGPAGRVAQRDGDVLERDAELLGGDLRHRGPRAGADVLHRRDDRRVAVRADADPGVARRPAAAVPDLRRHPDAALHRVGRAGAHLVPALPVRLGAPVALEQVLADVRACRRPASWFGVVAAPQLERVDVELGRELVEQALEPERPLDEPGRAERLHRRQVELRRRRSWSCTFAHA